MDLHVAGIDGWREGWIVAELHAGDLRLWHAATIETALPTLASADAVAIDMPIALAVSGRRSAEAEVRAVLGSSARSVFTSPTRRAIQASSQRDATELNRASDGPGISAQAYALFASIREVREALRGPHGNHWWETHPETAFAALNQGVPLPSKRTALGVAQRLAHLRIHFPTIDEALLHAPARVPIDDVLDALAAVWSAARIAAGRATVFGPNGRDDEGFAKGIRV